ncbi:hypothetical protein TCDM_10583 [Trypanosoma cruzi Dm28c]|uniref:Uncharacterized protein n=1 Tax=Trypanosoma cruzi Dm28c TaxID=1416333 RepID=V5B713_TRYCR|nr:hypothetical protein TCDM_10583 [Trypanosoma cruzi Dm28c]
MRPHVVDGRAHTAAGWAGGSQSAARWSARFCGAHVGRSFWRRQRRAILLSEGVTAPPTQKVTFDTEGTCRHVEEWAGIAPCLCAEPPLGARFPGRARNTVPATPTGACHAVYAPSFLLGIPPVRSPDCSKKVHVPDWVVLLREGSCNHGFVVSGLIAWDTAVRWREHEVYIVTSLYQGEQHNPTLFSDLASHGQWNDAECLNCRRGVRSHQHSCGRLGCSQTKGMRCLMPFLVARHSALYERASLPAAARWTSTGRSVVVVGPYNSAADPDASSARDEETSVHNSKS